MKKRILTAILGSRQTAIRYLCALILVTVVGMLLIKLQGENPGNAFALILKGGFGSINGFGSTLRYMMPCILLGTSAAVAFKTGVYNMGIEGQMYVGSLTAALVGGVVGISSGIHVLLAILSGALAGMLYALIPALLKLLFDVSEMVTTMMMNYIALLGTEFFVQWILLGDVAASNVAIETPKILESAELPTLIKGTSSSTGLFIALIVAVAIFVLFRYTIPGYELKQVGENPRFARAGGVNVSRTFLVIFLLSSLIAGTAGAIEVVGPYKKFTANYAGNLPWEGIMISFISRHSPLAIIVVSFIWGGLRAGGLYMERYTSLNKLTIYILQMLFVLFVSIDFQMVGRWIKRTYGKVLRKEAN